MQEEGDEMQYSRCWNTGSLRYRFKGETICHYEIL